MRQKSKEQMAQTIATTSRPAYQAYQILYIGFIAAPALAGLDKFTHFLTNWDQYLAPRSSDCFRSLVTRSCCSSGSLRWPPPYWSPRVRESARTSSRRGCSASSSISS